MRTQGSLGLERQRGVFVRRTGVVLREGVLLLAFLTLIESTGRYALHDGADVMALAGVSILLTLWIRGGRSGWLPLTGAALDHAGRGLRAALRRIAPGYAIAFRRSEAVVSQGDRVLLTPIAVIGSVAIIVLACGPWLFAGAEALKFDGSYTLYLVLMALVWTLQGAILLVGLIVGGTWVRRLGARKQMAPALALGLGWGISTALIARMPGIVTIGLLLLIAGWRWRTLALPLTGRYLFCRRDADGTPHVVPVRTLLLRAHGLAVGLLALSTALAMGPRLWKSAIPDLPFAFTGWLGLSAAVASLVVALQLGSHLRRIAGNPRLSPELPLNPTVWSRTLATDERPDWKRAARDLGWWVAHGSTPPDTGFDLVHGIPDHARRIEPRDDLDDDGLRFQLERRLHVVMRRRFHRRLQHLFKGLRTHKREPGSGFLFCPHIWLVPGVVRDAEPRRARRGPFMMPVFYGPAYGDVFDVRLRRYLGAVLRELEIDLIFWEDPITWRDLRRVTGVLFECYDQGRVPLRARHFVGLPRVRVLIQEEPAELESREPVPNQPPSPGHARILLIMRDRGADEEIPIDIPTGSSRRTPVLA